MGKLLFNIYMPGASGCEGLVAGGSVDAEGERVAAGGEAAGGGGGEVGREDDGGRASVHTRRCPNKQKQISNESTMTSERQEINKA